MINPIPELNDDRSKYFVLFYNNKRYRLKFLTRSETKVIEALKMYPNYTRRAIADSIGLSYENFCAALTKVFSKWLTPIRPDLTQNRKNNRITATKREERIKLCIEILSVMEMDLETPSSYEVG
jgi:hypothetical protein